jgi:tyrosine-protein phosphatase SIW14
MSRWASVLAAAGLAVFVAAAPAAYSYYRARHLRNFRVVTPGVLYRSGQLSQAGLERVVADHGIRTVVSLRYADSPDGPPPDAAEEAYCRSRGLRYVRVRPREWSADEGGAAPGVEGLRQFLEVVNDPTSHPVLLHCFAGMHRTGVYCAVYRMERDGWPNDRAIGEMKYCGYANIDREDDVRGFLEGYRPGLTK